MPTPERSRWWGRVLLMGLLALVLLGGVLGVRGLLRNFGGPQCRAVALGQEVVFDPEQIANAATITAVALKRGLPARAATIALATAIQESKLRNLDYGDRDSLGLFQQRPSQGWGTAAQVRDPVYATGKFYDALVKIEDYAAMDVTTVAQRVQRSAYPAAYADHEQEGRILASALAGHSPAGLGCRLDEAAGASPLAQVAADLRTQLGPQARSDAGRLVVATGSQQSAWAVGSWAVAQAERHGITRVTVGGREWSRTRDGQGWTWQAARTPAGASTSVVLAFD